MAQPDNPGGAGRRWLGWGGALLAAVMMAGALAWQWRAQARQADSLARRLAVIQPLPVEIAQPCQAWQARRPLVLLALGQSNAANHGTPAASPTVDVLHAGQCARLADPLPGGTGRGSSVWARLPAELAQRGVQRPVVLAVLAVDATTIADWTDADGPLPQRLAATLAANRAAGLLPDAVLWQQGESDARLGTPPERYHAGLRRLADQLHAAGVVAPVLLARSTVCRSGPDARLHAAVDELVRSDPRFAAGPDTDAALPAVARPDGCHLDAVGATVAARRWAEVLAPRLIGTAGVHAPGRPAPLVTARPLSAPSPHTDNVRLAAPATPRSGRHSAAVAGHSS